MKSFQNVKKELNFLNNPIQTHSQKYLPTQRTLFTRKLLTWKLRSFAGSGLRKVLRKEIINLSTKTYHFLGPCRDCDILLEFFHSPTEWPSLRRLPNFFASLFLTSPLVAPVKMIPDS